MIMISPFILLTIASLASAWKDLSDNSLNFLPNPSNADFDINTGKLLSPILIPRVPGTAGSLKVLNHFHNFFTSELPSWTLATQNSSSVTPTSNGKEIPFVNFMATRDPPWAQSGDVGRLVLVAHYDSKLTPKDFIGATDSAVPCALLLHIAQSIDAALTRKWADLEAKGETGDGLDDDDIARKGIMLLFLDGEEAFHNWSDDDSLYGARSLAETWEASHHPALSTRHNEIANVDLFLLLDLLGSQNPRIPSYFKTTHWAYNLMSDLESRMRESNLFLSHGASPGKWFYDPPMKPASADWHTILDDHIPFQARGVEIFHVIPIPFPNVWHTMNDDGKHLDMQTVKDWAYLTTAFTASWLELEGHVEAPLDTAGKIIDDIGIEKRDYKSEL
ncbi:peptidase M28 [Morchella snyderi]|nr:peptidase M28 [Morchella snyderi]